jgi:hypothetical protein
MKIVDFFWADEKSCIYTVDVTDLLCSAEELFVDVKCYLNVYEIWSLYVMENEDGTQIYNNNNGATYDMSKANQERVLEFVVKEIGI